MEKKEMFRVVIIDDEPDAIDVLTKFLQNFSSVKIRIVGNSHDLDSGLECIKKNKPDIVFLDIDLPGKNGLSIYDSIPEPEFKIVFVTAYDQYAIEALKKSASDYLLKPINIIELKETIKKVTKQIEKERQQEELIEKINFINNSGNEGVNVILDVEDGFIVENTNNIIYCLANQSYSVIITNTKKEIVVSKSLKQLQQQLPANQFIRTHKTYLVNIHHIKKFVRANESFVVLKNGDKIPVSVRTTPNFTKEIRQMLLK